MKLKNYAYRCVAVVCAIVAVACVDENFSIDKVSKEVSVLDGKTVLPLATFEKVTLGDLLKDADTSKLQKNEDGSYSFTYPIPEDTISPGDFELPTSFPIEEIGSSFSVDLPSLDFGTYSAGVDEEFGLNLTGGLSSLLDGVSEYELKQSYLDWMEMMGQETSLNAHIGETVKVDVVELALPEQIKNVSTVYFKSLEQGHIGAPLHVNLDMNGLADVNGGGHFSFVLMPTATDLLIYDNDGNVVERNDNGEYRVEMDIAGGAKNINFALFIAGLVNPNEPVDRQISIDPSMAFDISFELKAKPGIMRTGVPTVSVYSEFALDDAEVVFNSDVDLVNFEFGGENGSEGFSFGIDALPEQVKSINRINLDNESVFTLYANGFEWLKESSDFVTIDMTLPDCLVLRPIGNTYQYDEENHRLTMTIGDISEGLQIGVEAIDFGENGLSSADGPISIEFNPTVRVHFTNDKPISINNFITEDEINVSVGIHETTLGLESISAQIDFSEKIEEVLPVGEELGEDVLNGLELNGLGISPILEFMVTNPLTIEASISATITPMVGGVAQEESIIPINATIKQAVYDEATGVITPTATRIVLAKKEYEAQYPATEGYTFIECDLDNLFANSIPDSIALSASVALPQEVITLHLTDALEFSYGGNITLPIAFDSGLYISYEMTESILEDGESPLADIAAIRGIKVGDIALIAEFESTLPLELMVTTTLYNEDGVELPTKIGFVEGSNALKGSPDGETPVKQPLRLQFDLADEEGSLAELVDIATIGLKIEAQSSAEEGVVPLKDEQYITADLKLEIDGGVTVDLGKLKNKVEDELEDHLK